MPKLVRLYIISIATGFAISAVFVGALVWLDVARLGHLILETPQGWLAALLLFLFNGIVFAGVQFGIRVMGMAEQDDAPKGGGRAPLAARQPAPVVATAAPRTR